MRLGLTFDDVLLVPKYSEVASRKDVSLNTRFTKNFNLDIPIVSANMDTVTEFDMMLAMQKVGGAGILHRFLNPFQVGRICTWLQPYGKDYPRAVAIGINQVDNIERLIQAARGDANILCVDVAHGHHRRVIELIKELKDDYWAHGIDIIAGNVATAQGALALVEAGADAIKVGVGPGSLCTTRIVTGHGVPQLTAIMDVYNAIKGSGVPIIADGGIRTSGDIVKALAAGADTVMIGSLFAGTDEAPGEVVDGFKTYRGMASREAQMDWKGSVSVVEGEIQKIPYKGPVNQIIEELVDGLRSGMSYCGAEEIKEIREKAEMIYITQSGLKESYAHGLK
jgi:IMP dehydrogenase